MSLQDRDSHPQVFLLHTTLCTVHPFHSSFVRLFLFIILVLSRLCTLLLFLFNLSVSFVDDFLNKILLIFSPSLFSHSFCVSLMSLCTDISQKDLHVSWENNHSLDLKWDQCTRCEDTRYTERHCPLWHVIHCRCSMCDSLYVLHEEILYQSENMPLPVCPVCVSTCICDCLCMSLLSACLYIDMFIYSVISASKQLIYFHTFKLSRYNVHVLFFGMQYMIL